MRRVLIIGCGGAGKSTLARRLAALTGLPLIHLDQRYWRSGWVEPSLAEWDAEVAAMIAPPAWIIDGNYARTLQLRLAAADTAVFLDYPTWWCLANVLLRTLAGFGRVRRDMAPGCPERFDPAFLRMVWRFRAEQRPLVLAALADFPGETLVLRRPRQARSLLRRVARARRTCAPAS